MTDPLPTETARFPVEEMSVHLRQGALMGMKSLRARLLVEAAHLAWSNRDTAGLLACYCEVAALIAAADGK